MNAQTKTANRIARLIDKSLEKSDPFEATESIIQSPYFPKPWNQDAFMRLPDIIKVINRVRSFIIHSGGNGLFGLLTDYPVNIHIAEIEQSLKAISAKRSLRFIGHLKSALPGARYPATVEEAAAVERLILRADRDNSSKTVAIRRCIGAFAAETSGLAEELRQYLRRNRNELIDALLVF